MSDLAHYIASARSAGFQRYRLFGAREDGELGAIWADLGAIQDGPEPADLPLLRIYSQGVRFTSSAGGMIEVRREELADALPRFVRHLSSSRRSFAVQPRPDQTYGVVLPVIDALMSAAPNGTLPVYLMLPP